MRDTADTTVNSGFAELVCDDPAWLRAEFDAIMAANFGVLPPYPPIPKPGASGPRRGRPRRADGPVVPVEWDGRRSERRQRSPPCGSEAVLSAKGRG